MMSSPRTSPDCPVCFGPHHQPTHDASLDVRAWLRDEITRKLGGPSLEPEKPLRLIAPAPASRPLNERTRERKRAPKEPRQRFAKQPTKPRASRAAGRGSGWRRRDDITAEAIVQGWRDGMDMNDMAAKWGCNRSAVNKRLVEARRVSAEFRALEDEMQRCSCGKSKRPYQPVCAACGKDSRDADLPRRKQGGHNRKSGITVAAILDGWRRGLKGKDLAAEFDCNYKVISDRLREAEADPEVAAAIAAMRVCGCGRPKNPAYRQCRNCNQRDYQRIKSAASVSLPALVNPALDGTEQLEVRL